MSVSFQLCNGDTTNMASVQVIDLVGREGVEPSTKRLRAQRSFKNTCKNSAFRAPLSTIIAGSRLLRPYFASTNETPHYPLATDGTLTARSARQPFVGGKDAAEGVSP